MRVVGTWVDEVTGYLVQDVEHPHPLTTAVVAELAAARAEGRMPDHLVSVGPGLALAEVPDCLAGPAMPWVPRCPLDPRRAALVPAPPRRAAQERGAGS